MTKKKIQNWHKVTVLRPQKALFSSLPQECWRLFICSRCSVVVATLCRWGRVKYFKVLLFKAAWAEVHRVTISKGSEFDWAKCSRYDQLKRMPRAALITQLYKSLSTKSLNKYLHWTPLSRTCDLCSATYNKLELFRNLLIWSGKLTDLWVYMHIVYVAIFIFQCNYFYDISLFNKTVCSSLLRKTFFFFVLVQWKSKWVFLCLMLFELAFIPLNQL